MRTAPPEPGSALYLRSGSIVLAGALVLLAGLIQFGYAWLLFSVKDEYIPPDAALLGFVAKFFFVCAVLSLVVGVGVIRVRRWARWCAIAYGVVAIFFALLVAIQVGPQHLLQPAISNVVLFLLLRSRVGEAFREAAEARRVERERTAITSVRARA